MNKRYVKAYYDWIEQTAALSDAERGRLFIAILEYARSGLEPNLGGREGILFPVFRATLDRDNKIAETNSKNGALGGRGNKAVESETKRNKANESDQKATKDKRHKTKDKDEEKEKEKKEKEAAASQPSPAAVDAFFDSVWNLYPVKKGKGQVSKSKRLVLYKIGFDELSRAVDRYKTDLAKDSAWRKPQNGSTFFNSGYVDYLDENYTPNERSDTDGRNPGDGGKATLYGHYV